MRHRATRPPQRRSAFPMPSATAVSMALVTLAALVGPGAAPAVAQQEAPTNLQYFPHDIARDSLIEVMRQFSFALGVRCQYCHVGGDGISFEGVDFASDEDPDKRTARFMLRMVETVNRSMLPLLADRDEPPTEIGCKTCHRGMPKPVLLTDVVRATLDEEGAEAAVARYRDLRERRSMDGTFDFGEWETNTLAERLAAEGRDRDAIAIYALNLEYHPRSVSILLALGALHERVSEPERAVEYYDRVLEIAPGQARATARLEALRR